MAFSNSILSGVTLARQAIQSEGFQSGVQGWRITRDGDAEFNDVTVRGSVEVGDQGRVIIDENQWPGNTVPSVNFALPGQPNYSGRLGAVAGFFRDPGTDDERSTLAIFPIGLENQSGDEAHFARINLETEVRGPIDRPSRRPIVALDAIDEFDVKHEVLFAINGDFEQTGTDDVNVTSGSSFAVQSITFPHAFTSAPTHVQVSSGQGLVGSLTVVATYDTLTASGMRLIVRSGNNANFGGTAVYSVAWRVKGPIA